MCVRGWVTSTPPTWTRPSAARSRSWAARSAAQRRRASPGRGGYSPATKICIPVTPDGHVDPRWGRAQRVAIASVNAGRVNGWEEFDVGWGTVHDQGPEGTHHARVARFLQEHDVELVVADHMGPGMAQMLAKMGIAVRLGASGPARDAVLASRTLN